LHGVVTVLSNPRKSSARPRLTDEPGIRFGIANAVLVAALIVAWAVGLDVTATAVLAVVVASVASVRLPIVTALALGVIGWALFTGFVEHRYGQLTFTDDDVRRLASFAFATSALSFLMRHLQHTAQEPTRG
jgi:branched-subunit amino acid ABC-type transport system permease component